jgi:hypothetical protein
MDGISRALGESVPVALGGETYLLAPITLGIFGICENRILLRRKTPIEAAGPLLVTTSDPVLRQRIVEKTRAELKANPLLRIVTSGEMISWLDSQEGIYLTAWLCLRENHPAEFGTFSITRERYDAASEQERLDFLKARNHVSGLSELCTLDWPQEEDMVPAAALERKKKIEGQIYRRANWRLNFRKIVTEGFGGMDLDSVRRLTIYQWRMLTSDEKSLTVSDICTGKKRTGAQQLIHIGRDGTGLKEFEEAMRGYRREGS